jgi:hypothetical protein
MVGVRRLGGGALLFGGAAAGAGAILDPGYAASAVRLGRCAVVAARMTVDYKLTLWRMQGLSEGEKQGGQEADRAAAAGERARQAMLDEAHQRNAERLKRTLFANRGIYIKVGQHLGLLDYLLPVRVQRGSQLNHSHSAQRRSQSARLPLPLPLPLPEESMCMRWSGCGGDKPCGSRSTWTPCAAASTTRRRRHGRRWPPRCAPSWGGRSRRSSTSSSARRSPRHRWRRCTAPGCGVGRGRGSRHSCSPSRCSTRGAQHRP